MPSTANPGNEGAGEQRSPRGQPPGLRRDLGKLQGYATIIGTLVGSGIFVVTGTAGGIAGPGVILAYVILGPIILASTMAYSVYLSTPLGRSPGGAYLHMSRTHGFYFLGYILGWLKWVAFIGALSILSLSLGQYVTVYVPNVGPQAIAIVTLVVFYLINLVGVKYFGYAQACIFAILVVALAVLIIPGLIAIDGTNLDPFLPFGMNGVLAVLVPLFFAFLGFESLAQTAGETRNARASLPRVFALGVATAVVLYIVMSLVAFGAVPYDQLAGEQAPMTAAASTYLPAGAAVIVSIGAVAAFITSLNTALLAPGRLLYVMAGDRVVPRFLAHVNERWRTPDVALTISTAVGIFLLSTKTLDYMLDVALQALFLMYGAHSLTMAVLPYVRPELYARARLRAPRWLMAVAGIYSAGWLAYFTYLTLPSVIRLLAIWVGVGVVLYAVARYMGAKEGFDYKRGLHADWADEPVAQVDRVGGAG